MQLAQPLELVKAGGVVGLIPGPGDQGKRILFVKNSYRFGNRQRLCTEPGKQLTVQFYLPVVWRIPALRRPIVLSCFSYSSGSVYSL